MGMEMLILYIVAVTGGFYFYFCTTSAVNSGSLIAQINSSSNIICNNIGANNKSSITILQTNVTSLQATDTILKNKINKVNTTITNMSYVSGVTTFFDKITIIANELNFNSTNSCINLNTAKTNYIQCINISTVFGQIIHGYLENLARKQKILHEKEI